MSAVLDAEANTDRRIVDGAPSMNLPTAHLLTALAAQAQITRTAVDRFLAALNDGACPECGWPTRERATEVSCTHCDWWWEL